MTNGNDLAYPASYEERTSEWGNIPDIMQCFTGGLSKREYFAAMAMQGVVSAQAGTKEMVLQQLKYYAEEYPNHRYIDALAIESVKLADALIKSLNDKP